jgi:cytochrome c553
MKTLSGPSSRILCALIMISNANLVYAQNMERGKAQYGQFCASCHGIAAKGDGPLAKSLNPPRPISPSLRKEMADTFH